MKKTYEKARIVFEKYEMSQNIASCGWDVKTMSSLESCGAIGDSSSEFNNPSVKIFSDTGVCEVTDVEAYCYELSSAGLGTFNS